MSGTLIGAAYRAVWELAARTPHAAAARLFNRVSDTLVARRGPAVVQLARNQRRVLGSGADPASLHAVVRAAMRSYGRYWLETFRMERADGEEIAQRALDGSIGLQHIAAARDAGRGIILALPHSGNWDVAGMSMVRMLGGITTVAERLEPPAVYRRFVDYRQRLGFEVLPLTGDSGAAGYASSVLRERLVQGRMVCLLADRDLGTGGIPVSFFGEHTTMPAGPAMLAALTGAALCPVHLAYTDTGWIQHVSPPVELSGTRLAEQVRSGTQRMADRFAERIALFPADWHMLQPLWSAARRAAGRASRDGASRDGASGDGASGDGASGDGASAGGPSGDGASPGGPPGDGTRIEAPA